MVKYLSIPLCLFLLSCSQQEQPQTEVKQEPTADKVVSQQMPALHIQPARYDLGDIKEGEAAIATFIVRNNSKQAIELVDIQASCGCTAAEPDSYIIPSNGFTQLKVAVDTTAKQEGIKKAVYITDSLGNKATATLTFNVVSNPHLKMGAVKGIFDGQCASCHFQPLKAVVEPSKLYDVGCAMCHGEGATGAYAPDLRHLDTQTLTTIIAQGVGKPQMPGFAMKHGGPLSEQQIHDLAIWIASLP